MRITLEMVDDVINRTNVSYKIAKEALEKTDGDVLKAIVEIEALQTGSSNKAKKLTGHEVVEWLKNLVNEGFINQIMIERNGKTVLDIPIVAGALGALIFTVPTVAAIIAALATGCVIKIVNKEGITININEFTHQKLNEVKSYINPDQQTTDSSKNESEEANPKDDDEDYFVS